MSDSLVTARFQKGDLMESFLKNLSMFVVNLISLSIGDGYCVSANESCQGYLVLLQSCASRKLGEKHPLRTQQSDNSSHKRNDLQGLNISCLIKKRIGHIVF